MRRLGGVFAAAKPDRSGLIGVVLHRRESRAFVRPVAERLLGGLTTRTPPIGLPRLDIHGVRRFAGNDWIGHDENS